MADIAVKKTTEDSAHELSKERLRVWIKLFKATRFLENRCKERMRTEFDITVPRFDVMAALYRSETPLTMSELSKYLMVTNGNVTGLVERLNEDGLIKRRISREDRRTTFVSLTEQGREMFAIYAEEHERLINFLMDDLEMDDLNTLSHMLGKIINIGPKAAS